MNIEYYLSQIPEQYQDIYNHPEYDNNKRNCNERLIAISGIIKAYQSLVGKKNIKVLDLGCAQGFFSFSLAEMGCEVTGVDFCEENIRLCNVLQLENGLNCVFEKRCINEDYINGLERYDIVLLFSVIHHIAYSSCFEKARKMLDTIIRKNGMVLMEIALKEEPLYWNMALPSKYDEWFGECFYRKLGRYHTHLSSIERPLVYASDKYIWINNSLYVIQYELKQRQIKNDTRKRYYLSDENLLIKWFFNVEQKQRIELKKESEIIKQIADLEYVPQMLFYEEDDESQIEGLRIHKGENLYEMICEGRTIDYMRIFGDIIAELIILEERKLFHQDIRAWNICIDTSKGKAFLIDYGSLSSVNEDVNICGFIRNNRKVTTYDTYVSLIYDCVCGNYGVFEQGLHQDFIPSTYFFYNSIGERCASFLQEYQLLEEDQKSFKTIKGLYDKYTDSKTPKPSYGKEERIDLLEKQFEGLILDLKTKEDEYNGLAYLNHECMNRIEFLEKIELKIRREYGTEIKKLNRELYRRYMLDAIEGKSIALYGAGKHTIEVLGIIGDKTKVKFIIAENNKENITGIPIIKLSNCDLTEIDAILISSFRFREEMKNELIEYKGTIVDVYEMLSNNGIEFNKEFYI